MRFMVVYTTVFLLLPMIVLAQEISDVPFTPQAPYGQWNDPRQQQGCEEASALMTIRWVQRRGLAADEALRTMLAIAAFEKRSYGSYHDTSAADTIARIFLGYFKYPNVFLRKNILADDIIAALSKGLLVIVPVNGRALKNPFYKPPGPRDHMLVVIGYDSATHEFITNDPGTRHGEGFRYGRARMVNAIGDYPTSGGTGQKSKRDELSERRTWQRTKVMIVVARPSK